MSERFRILVCGGRDFADADFVNDTLDRVLRKHPYMFLIHGAARGADTLAAEWADSRRVPAKAYPAEWGKFGKQAGPIRNQQMIDDGKPDAVVAFPGGAGTADMVERAKEHWLPVWEVAP